jgi:hypothetical protein
MIYFFFSLCFEELFRFPVTVPALYVIHPSDGKLALFWLAVCSEPFAMLMLMVCCLSLFSIPLSVAVSVPLFSSGRSLVRFGIAKV